MYNKYIVGIGSFICDNIAVLMFDITGWEDYYRMGGMWCSTRLNAASLLNLHGSCNTRAVLIKHGTWMWAGVSVMSAHMCLVGPWSLVSTSWFDACKVTAFFLHYITWLTHSTKQSSLTCCSASIFNCHISSPQGAMVNLRHLTPLFVLRVVNIESVRRHFSFWLTDNHTRLKDLCFLTYNFDI